MSEKKPETKEKEQAASSINDKAYFAAKTIEELNTSLEASSHVINMTPPIFPTCLKVAALKLEAIFGPGLKEMPNALIHTLNQILEVTGQKVRLIDHGLPTFASFYYNKHKAGDSESTIYTRILHKFNGDKVGKPQLISYKEYHTHMHPDITPKELAKLNDEVGIEPKVVKVY